MKRLSKSKKTQQFNIDTRAELNALHQLGNQYNNAHLVSYGGDNIQTDNAIDGNLYYMIGNDKIYLFCVEVFAYAIRGENPEDCLGVVAVPINDDGTAKSQFLYADILHDTTARQATSINTLDIHGMELLKCKTINNVEEAKQEMRQKFKNFKAFGEWQA